MDIKKLHFFDKNGYELNFYFNEDRNCWEGNIFLPPVSLGLYSNTTIHVLEETDIPTNINSYKKHFKNDEQETIFVFPRKSKNGGDTLTFRWDNLNAYVDEIFMFTFDENYKPNAHSSLSYRYNDGPDCKTLLVNRFEQYVVNLDSDIEITDRQAKRALPIHVAFSASPQFDSNTYKRTLIMSYDDDVIARITYFAESVEEDERLKVWNYNLGYTLTPDDTIIFKESDIEEPNPNYLLLNEKRKELLIEGHNIYPYIGSYKAILSAIKFFGYDNLNIVEFWKCINPDDDNFGQFIMSPKYVLSDRETTFVKDSPIEFPNDSYRKGNKLAFTYTINTPTDKVDLYELPYVKEDFKFSFGEILIKLFALRKKLNKEFMPSTSKIIDIIGEASYFGIQLIKNAFSYSVVEKKRDPIKLSIDCYPGKHIKISDDKFFNDFLFECKNADKNEDIETITILNNIKDKQLKDFNDQAPLLKGANVNDLGLSELEKSDLFKKYHKALTYTFTETEDVVDNDLYKEIVLIPEELCSFNDNDYTTKLGNNISAKIVLSNTTFKEITFDDLPYPFKYIGTAFNKIDTITDFMFNWENNIYLQKDHNIYLKWCVSFSEDQLDEDYHDNERKKHYDSIKERYNFTKNPLFNNEYECLWDWTPRIDGEDTYLTEATKYRKQFKSIKYGEISEMSKVLFELPYVGYYDVTLTIYKEITTHDSVVNRTGKETVIYNTREFKKYIKVEPHNLDIRGFYYDSRDIPNVQTDNKDEEFENYILNTLNYLTYIAKHDVDKINYKKDGFGGLDMQMIMNPHLNKINEHKYIYNLYDGPFAKQNFKFGDYIIQDGEFIVDNINKDIVTLIPTMKTAKYIRNGVDVKPYTWIYLTFDYSKIVHRCNPLWTLTNKTTHKTITYTGKYLTCLLRDEGNYTVSLSLSDEFGNTYSLERNIIVVDKGANHKFYTPFSNEYKSNKAYEDYKNDIRMAALMDNGIDENDTGEYMFDFKVLKEYEYNEFIHCLNRDKPKHTREITELSGRLSIKPEYGIGWGYDVPYEINYFDELNIEFENEIPSYYDLSLFIVQNPTSYDEIKITSKSTVIKVSDIKNVDLANISYIIFFNKTTDNVIEIKINNIYFSYNYDNHGYINTL